MFVIFLVTILGAMSSVVRAADYVKFNELITIVEQEKGLEEVDMCENVVLNMNEKLMGLNHPNLDDPRFNYTIELYLNMGKEASIYAQKLEYIKIFVRCLEIFQYETLPFAYYAHMILSSPTKRLDESDLVKSGAISSLAEAGEIKDFVTKKMITVAFSTQDEFPPMDPYCRSFGLKIISYLSGHAVNEAGLQDIVKIFEKAKASLLHSRNLNNIWWVSDCQIAFHQGTASLEFYRQLYYDINDLLPEDIIDVYHGILAYEDEDSENSADYPTISIVVAAVNQHPESEPMRCLHIAMHIFRLVHSGIMFNISPTKFYHRMVKIMKYSRDVVRKTMRRRYEATFRYCIDVLIDMYDNTIENYQNPMSDSEDSN